MSKNKATHYAVFILAKVHGPGLVDMLRYDSCCPANEGESYRLEQAFHQEANSWVIFKRFVPIGGFPEPNAARWRSFSTPCVEQAFKSYEEADYKRRALRAAEEKKAS
jgi:hypothetical protein